MAGEHALRRWRGIALGALVLLGVAGVVLRFDGSRLAEVTRYRDDAYYYFVFVRSWVGGEGPCVTPGAPTSGVHLLWACLLAPLAALFGPQSLLVGAQHLGLGLHVLTALGLFVQLGGGARALALASLYVGNPFLVDEAQNGQETALACAMTLLLWWGFGRGIAVASAVAVLATLARSDLILLAAGFAVARFGWRLRAAVPLAVALAVYAATNLALAGHWLQDSAAPIPWLFATHFERTQPDFAQRVQRFWWYLRPCLLGGPFGVVSPVLGGVLTATAVAAWLRARWFFVPLLLTGFGAVLGARDVTVPLIASLLLLGYGALDDVQGRAAHAGRAYSAALLSFAALVALHLVVRTYPRDYYFAPMGVLGVLAFGALPSRLAHVACALWALSQVLALATTPRVAHTWQEQMAMAGRFLRTVVPAGEPVGCFNSGIVAFYDEGPVRNLDGVVNRAAFVALRKGNLNAYLDTHAVRFLVDSQIQFRVDDPWPHSSGAHFGAGFTLARDLVVVARCVVPGVREPFAVYWRRGRGELPPPPTGARVLGPAPAPRAGRPGAYVLWPAPAPGRLHLGALAGGASAVVAEVDQPTTVIVRVDAPSAGRYGLFVDAAPAPILTVDL
jgi:hypothetical protein